MMDKTASKGAFSWIKLSVNSQQDIFIQYSYRVYFMYSNVTLALENWIFRVGLPTQT